MRPPARSPGPQMLIDSDGQEAPDMPSPRTRTRIKPKPAVTRPGVGPDGKARARTPRPPPEGSPAGPRIQRASQRRESPHPSPKGVGDGAQLARSRAAYRLTGKEAAVRTSPDAIPESP